MKDIKELNPRGFPLTPVIEKNLEILFERLMELQDASGIDFTLTSGLRSEEFQQSLIAAGKTNAKFSKHLAGLAADIADPKGELGKWIMKNLQVLSNIGLWMEDLKHTKGWVHLQATPPKSGNRVFIP